jgi:hypothetical protein
MPDVDEPLRSAAVSLGRAREEGSTRDLQSSETSIPMRATESIDPAGINEPLTALEPEPTKRARTVGHIPHDASVRVGRRVKQILDRRDTALKHARDAARRLNGGDRAVDQSGARGR